MRKPKIFIGSSGEDSKIARDLIRANSRSLIELRSWTDIDAFNYSEYTLNDLLRLIPESDGCVLLAFGVDKVSSRGSIKKTPRDNVLIEAGMAFAVLGKDRTLIIIDDGTKKPSDFLGLNTIIHNKADNINDLRANIDAHFEKVLLNSGPVHLSATEPERFPKLEWRRFEKAFLDTDTCLIKKALECLQQRKLVEARQFIKDIKHPLCEYICCHISLAKGEWDNAKKYTLAQLKKSSELIINDKKYDAYWLVEIASRRLLKIFQDLTNVWSVLDKVAEVYQPADLFHMKGLLEISQGNYMVAVRYYDRAIQEGSTNPWTWVDKAECLHKIGDKEDLRNTLYMLQSKWPDNINIECLFRYLSE